MTSELNMGIRKAILYEKLKGGSVRCQVCERKCIIEVGSKGYCGTRVNIEGNLYTLCYGNLSAVESRPIEIKPFYHFWPGSSALTFSSWSCNFPCPWCQNWELSKNLPQPGKANYISPEKIVRLTVKKGDKGVCASFNEPITQFEYTLDVFKLASKNNLYTTYVSNGYMTELALKRLALEGLNGLKIDIKGDKHVYREVLRASPEIPWRNVKLAKQLGLHVEVVFLMVTGLCDDEEVVRNVVINHLKYAGPKTPLHITRYFPAYQYMEKPTPIESMERAYKLARKEGIEYVYLGNVPGHPYEHTYCPKCGHVLIKRYGVMIVRYKITGRNSCPYCGEKIPIIGKYCRELT